MKPVVDLLGRHSDASGKLRGAVVGCGNIAEFHLRGWQRIPEVEIVALADPVRANGEDRRARFAPQARVYERLDTLLSAEKLDFVEILTPPWMHREHCLRAKEAGVHVICQKPLCDTLADARALVAAFDGYPKHFCVHENHPFRPWFQHVAKLHREGFFGTFRQVRLEHHEPMEPQEKNNLEAERGVLLQYGVHLVDMLRKLLGTPEWVSARLDRVNPRVRGESLAHVLFEYPQATAVVNVAWKNGGVRHGSTYFLGDQGEALFDGGMTRGESTRLRVAQGSAILLDETRSSLDDYVDSFYLYPRAFVDALLNGSPPPQPATENLQTVEMTFAAYAAAEQGRPVCYRDFQRLI